MFSYWGTTSNSKGGVEKRHSPLKVTTKHHMMLLGWCLFSSNPANNQQKQGNANHVDGKYIWNQEKLVIIIWGKYLDIFNRHSRNKRNRDKKPYNFSPILQVEPLCRSIASDERI